MVCDKALPATDLLALLYLPSVKILDAVDATLELVCFLLAIGTPPFVYIVLLFNTVVIIPQYIGIYNRKVLRKCYENVKLSKTGGNDR